MKVLHVAQSVSGGIASYLEEIAGHQSRVFGKRSVRFLVPAGNRQHLPSVPEAQLAEFSPGTRSPKGFAALWTAIRREIAEFAPDVLHLHSTYAGVLGRVALPLFGPRPAVVYCAHGWSFGMEAPRWKQKLFAAVERSLVPATAMIVNISETDHALARSHGLPARRMTTVRNGIAAAPPAAGIYPAQFDAAKINLIFVGRHDRQKGLDFLLDAFLNANVPGVHLHVVGAPVLEVEEGVEQAALPDTVTFHGWQPRAAVSALMAASDALVMPSRWEGFGLVALEAMRLGKPVLASRRGALSEIVTHGETGQLFGLETTGELRELLGCLDKRELARLGANARQHFLRHFTADRLNSELVSLYETVTGGNARRGFAQPAPVPVRIDGLRRHER